MTYPESWTCPTCGTTIFNNIKCRTCGYEPRAESGPLSMQVKQEPLLKERILAFLIDMGFVALIGLLISLSMSLGLSISFGKGFEVLLPLFIIPVMIITLALHPVYFIILEARFSKTYGKKIMHLKVVKDNEDIRLTDSITRNGLRFIEALTLYIISIIMIKQNNQRLGDRIAKTQVVRT